MRARSGVAEVVQVPTDKQLESLIADLNAIQKRIEAFTVTLTSAQRLATTKMRPGGDAIVATLSKLARERQVALPEVNVESMNDNLALAQGLRPVADASAALSRRLEDTITHAQGACWWTATALYTALARVAVANPELEVALQPVVSFFATGKRKKTKKTPPSSSTPPASAAG